MSIGGTCPGVIMADPCIKRGTECFWNFLIRFLLPLECAKMMIKESDISLDQDRGLPPRTVLSNASSVDQGKEC